MDWKKIFDSLGLSGTWWQWRILRWQEKWQNFRDGLRTRAENVGYEHRLCANCFGLIDRDTTICPRCGAKLENFRRVQMRRAAGMIVPENFTVSYLLIALNVAILAAFMIRFGGLKLFGADTRDLARAGALMPALVLNGEWWRVITYAFLHGGFLHIFFNMSSLSQLGPITENEIGRSRFLVVYLLCAVGGATADMVWNAYFGTRPLVVGASGAIFGLIGFGLAFNYATGGYRGRETSRTYLQWAIYSFAYAFAIPNVDNVCHGGGFITGALLGLLIAHDLRLGDRFRTVWRIAAALCAIATLAAFAMVITQKSHTFFFIPHG
jgi:rhomboid protease GluP